MQSQTARNVEPFNTGYDQILEKLEAINPVQYAKTRNYLDGAVSRLSPYISRGVISINQVRQAMLDKGFKPYEMQRFLQELGWREYFQRIWQAKGEEIFQDLRQPQAEVNHGEMIAAFHEASTGIDAIDESIRQLYETGYMHNHMRMYVSSTACNIGRAHWFQPSRWLYYHLLDGDLASNSLNWQWIAGSFSSKKYYANQENINKFTGTQQRNSFLDKNYSELPGMKLPDSLTERMTFQAIAPLPEQVKPVVDSDKHTLLYNSYNLDPLWRKDDDANRILLLEPSHFKKFPVSQNVLDFIVSLSANIPGLQVFSGELSELYAAYQLPEDQVKASFISKEHPAFLHYPGNRDDRDWMYPQVSGYFPSFSGFWKRCEKAAFGRGL